MSSFSHHLLSQGIEDETYSEALSHLKTNELDEAEAIVRAQLKDQPASGKFNELLGRIIFAKKNYDEAINHYQATLEQSPERVSIYYHMGDAYFRQMNWADAFANFRAHAESDPPAIQSRLKMIYCLAAVENYAAAIKLISTLDPIDNFSPAYYYGRAALAHCKNETEDFENALRQVRTIYGTDTFNSYMPDLIFLMKATRKEEPSPVEDTKSEEEISSQETLPSDS
ncbi:MAG: tetratricopeptide repeat protein [Verrucomicrobiota bacterium]